MKIYFAGSLFSMAERNFNTALAELLKGLNPRLEIILPQDFMKGESGEVFENETFRFCISGVMEADVVLAILDGADADSGTCFELGLAYAKNKRIVGVRTDFRGDGTSLNLMIEKALSHYIQIKDQSTFMKEAAVEINNYLEKLC